MTRAKRLLTQTRDSRLGFAIMICSVANSRDRAGYASVAIAAILCQVFGGAISFNVLSLIDESAWAAADL